MTPSPGSTRHADDHTVVSVGPYTFHTDVARRSRSSARFRDSASPPHSTFRRGFPFQPDSSSRRHVAGVACITVAPDDDIRCISRCPSRASSRVARATLAPLSKGRYSSSAAMSKDSVVTDNNTSASVRPGSRAIDSSRFTSERCVTATPFGRPVEPEVKIT